MKRMLLALLAICLFSVVAFAQETSSLRGTVTDPNGAVVSGATVKLTDTKTGNALTDTTNDQGGYSFVKVRPGAGYELSFAAQGFQTLVVKDVALGVGITETHNIQLTVGQVSSTVVVTSSGEATLNTTDASIGNVIDSRRMSDLPIQIRSSPAALLSLQPGVVGNNVGVPGSTRVGSVTGSRADQGNITIDGIDANDQTTGQAFTTVGNAPIDAIQEFRGVTANPGAEQGRSSGGEIQLVTKGGSNSFHGNVREFNRTAKTAANSWFNNAAGRRADGTFVSPRPQLTRNQFGGSLGGPVIKNKLFFFQDYEGRRDAQGVTNTRTVPLNHVRNGSVAYVTNAAGCASTSRLNTTPGCVTILTPAQVAALDPKGIGADAALLAFMNGRYPQANDLTLGDGVNTGGFRFNSPSHRKENTYTTRIDYNFKDNQKFFGRFNFARRLQTDTVNSVAQQFPGDPESGQIAVRDYAWVVGHTWTPSATVTNQATVGVTRQGASFPRPFHPAFPQIFTFGPLSAPFAGISFQDRFVPVPTIRDDLTLIKGSHTLQLGGSFKPIRQKTSLINDFNFATVGLGGLNTSLNSSLRPGDIRTATTTNTGQYDSAFAFLLGRYASIATNFNYSPAGVASPPGTGKKRDWRYNEYEIYAQDTWKVRSSLTMTYGVRWFYYSPPYEANGFQAINDVDLTNLFNLRVQNAAAGVSGNSAEPFLRYDLGGKANNVRGFSDPDLNNFGPRLSLAWNPSFKNGFLSKVFGDRKTVLRAGSSVVYDRIGGAITFIQDQVSYIFDNSATTQFGATTANTALLNDPRFTGILTLPIANVAPTITHPFTPFVTAGVPIGNRTGQFNYAVDQHFRTPYSIEYSAGLQRELPGKMILDVSYVGRQGRKLFTQADAAQALDFKDPASGQFMFAAYNALQAQLAAGLTGASITAQPWFENQMNPANIASRGATCLAFFGVSCTRVVAANFATQIIRGDTSDNLQALYGNFLLLPNVGLSGQFSTNAYISNQGASSYNGLLLSLRRRFANGFQADFNYTLSHSLDNQSAIANTVAGGVVCDLRNLRVCRGPSDFDVRQLVNVNFLYELPFGKGHSFASNAHGVLNQIIGGWEVSGIFTARSGVPFSTTTGAFPVGFNFNSPQFITGSLSALQNGIHTTPTGTVQFFTDPTTALAAMRFPQHGEIGNRNALRGPSFWGIDSAVLKNFKVSEKWGRIQLRWEAFNALNHNVFALPNASTTSASFGQITSSATSPREMQFGIRWDF